MRTDERLQVAGGRPGPNEIVRPFRWCKVGPLIDRGHRSLSIGPLTVIRPLMRSRLANAYLSLTLCAIIIQS